MNSKRGTQPKNLTDYIDNKENHTLAGTTGDEVFSMSLAIRREPAASAFPASLSNTVHMAEAAFSIWTALLLEYQS